MHFLKKFAAFLAVLGVAAFAGHAEAFTAPTSIAAFVPAANVVTVHKITSTVAGVDQYMCSTGNVLSVTANTPLSTVQKLASSNLAFAKFKIATLTPAQRLNPLQVQAATIWFMTNIGRPLYGL
jgi:hypothetical protein